MPVSDMEDAADEEPGPGHEGPPGLDGQARRAAIGRDRLEQGGYLASESFRARGRFVEGQDRKSAADVEGVEVRPRPAQERAEGQRPADRVPPGVHGAELRADVEVDAARGQTTSRRHDGDRRRELVGRHPELRARRPDREAGRGLGHDRRVDAQEDIETPTADARLGNRREGPCLVGGLDGQPARGIAGMRGAREFFNLGAD